MKLENERESDQIEDRRGMGAGAGGGGFGARGLATGGIGGIVVIVIALFMGVDPSALLQVGGLAPEPGPSQTAGPLPGAPDDGRAFVARVLGSTEQVWEEIFAKSGRPYEKPVLVLFSGSVRSACGLAESASGPFYCPGDRKLYIDLDFYRELRDRFLAPGDFAQAYVIAHEVGHHVQNLLGVMGKVQEAQQRAQQRISEREANALSVRLELQADCLAGIWAATANRARRILEPGDIDEGLNAAAMIGDDTLQRRAQGRVVPDAFTHGSAEQRVRWFRKGLDTGSIAQCDTFSGRI